MPKVDIVNIKGEQVGEIELSEGIFGVEPNQPVMHQVVVAQLANRRQGTQSALTRSEVSGGGRKPFRQKGTGRARQGSSRAPQMRHGGMVFAVKPRDYSQKVNKKVRRLAMKGALSSKVNAQQIIVLDTLDISGKTRDFKQMLEVLGIEGKALIVTEGINENLRRASSNLSGIRPSLVNTLNVYDILVHDKFVVTRQALQRIEEVYV